MSNMANPVQLSLYETQSAVNQVNSVARSRKALNGRTLGLEETLWQTADKLRGNMDAAEYKHTVLGLVFLKYISDVFQEHYDHLSAQSGADPENKLEYSERKAFWVPPEARWAYLHTNSTQPIIGKLVDDAMVAIEADNPSLSGALPKNYARPELNQDRLGGVIDLIGRIALGSAESRATDVLGRAYEYFLAKFAAAEGKLGGEFYTPQSVVRLLVEMIEPMKGRVYDPCCGSGGMFVQSEKFVEAHGGRRDDLSIYGQESNATTWRLAKMNLAIRGIEANLGSHGDDTFHNNLHKDLRADYILANPPFNLSDWGGERLRDDVRWKYGIPPIGNSNLAWVQHFLHQLSPDGIAGFVLSNGALSSNQAGDLKIRKGIIEDDLLDCVVYLPQQLFYTTQISVSLWFLTRNKNKLGERNRRGESLFIYAYDLGVMVDRTHRELCSSDIERISNAYLRWKGSDDSAPYADELGFCKSADIQEIRDHRFAIVPGRYVGFAESARLDDDQQQLSGEFEMIRDRFAMIGKASENALATLKGLSRG